MRTKKAIEHFGSKAVIADTLKISRPSVSRWGDIVPLQRAWQLRTLSKGKLAMRLSDYR